MICNGVRGQVSNNKRLEFSWINIELIPVYRQISSSICCTILLCYSPILHIVFETAWNCLITSEALVYISTSQTFPVFTYIIRCRCEVNYFTHLVTGMNLMSTNTWSEIWAYNKMSIAWKPHWVSRYYSTKHFPEEPRKKSARGKIYQRNNRKHRDEVCAKDR